MSDARRTLALLGAAAALTACLAAASDGPSKRKRSQPPPRKPATAAKKPAPRPADNSYCLVCHANYKRERVAAAHQPVGVGCARCHGESDKHSSDENGITPPDVIYAREDVAKACATCHTAAKLQKAHAKIARNIHAKGPDGKWALKPCTDCHSTHRLQVRTRRWDKKTRELIQDDGVRMTR